MANYVVLSGSLRQASMNTAVAKALAHLTEDGEHSVALHALTDLPLYNQDIEAAGFPESVQSLAADINDADGLILVTPEYNGYFTPVLHSALDWMSRSINEQKVLDDKPVALLAASPGPGAGVRALEQLKHYSLNLKMRVYPQVHGVGSAHTKINASGEIADAKTLEQLTSFLDGFTEWHG